MQKKRDRPTKAKRKKKTSLSKVFGDLGRKLKKSFKSKKPKAEKKPKPKAKKVSFKESFNSFKTKMKNAFKVKPKKKTQTSSVKSKPKSINIKGGASAIVACLLIVTLFGGLFSSSGTTVKYVKSNIIPAPNEIIANGEYLASDFGADGINKFNVNIPMPTISAAPVTITQNGTYYASDFGIDGINEVTVNVQNNDINYNISYGDTPPIDTSKLWVKTSKPDVVKVTSNFVIGSEEIAFGISALPVASYGITAAAVGTKVYLFGGRDSKGCLNTINVFDTESGEITTLSATLPTAASDVASATVGTKVYLFGGRGSNGYLNTINVFDTESGVVTTLSTKLPTSACRIAAEAIGTKVYLFGGCSSNTSLNTINVFDTETGTITSLSAKLPNLGDGVASAMVGTKVYLFGGSTTDWMTRCDTISVFDAEDQTITTLDMTLLDVACQMTAKSVGTKVYLFGGAYGSSSANVYQAINVFDTESNTITTLSTELPTSAYSIAAEAIGTKVYLFGGQHNGGLNQINAFVALSELSVDNMLIEISTAGNMINLLPSIEIGVKNIYIGNADGYAEKVTAAIYIDGKWKEI